MTKKYDTLVFIGRFQPLHNGHCAVIQRATELAENVIVVVGSAFASRTIRNPFTYEERSEFIIKTFPKVITVPARDYPYNDTKWVSNVREKVFAAMEYRGIGKGEIGLIGHSKDETSYYLNMFPGWKSESVPAFLVNGVTVDATEIRNRFLTTVWVENWYRERLPDAVFDYISRLLCCGVYDEGYIADLNNLFEDYDMVQHYKRAWEVAPYPPTFVTTDAVVVASGHVLLVERKASPGKGLTALPGGFLNQKETLLQGCIRELREETKLKVPENVLIGSVKSQHTFDSPNRSSRGRTITTAFHIDLGFMEKLPKVRGSDDAKTAFWKPLNEIDTAEMFEDHWHIIEHFTGV